MNIKTNPLLLVMLLFHTSITSVFAQSRAHEYSKFAVIDPAYNSNFIYPESALNEFADTWIYGSSELESWRLQLIQQRKDSAKLYVGYPGVFHKPFTEGSFRLKPEDPQILQSIQFRAVGEGKIYINGLLAGEFAYSESVQSVDLKKAIKVNLIQFDMHSTNDPIALLVEGNELSTTSKKWEWKHKNSDWEPAFHFSQNNQNVPPHRLEDPTVLIKPERVDGNLYDFGKELYGFITIKSQSKLEINVGESIKEALDVNNRQKEQSLDMVNTSGGMWKSKHPLAFRYLYVENKQIEDIACDAIFSTASYKGAFACSDSILTQIWMNSAYTLRMCMHDFILDGIKRDRLPWTGDLAMSLLVNAYTFSEPELIRRSLVALGRSGIKEKDINGIIDYSLWWIIAQDHYQLFFADTFHLTYEWNRIREALNDLSARCDSNGFLIPAKDNWLFIDWVEQEKWTALQILWWWAQKSGAKLARRIGDSETATYWENSSSKLKINLLNAAWSEEEQIWLSKNDSNSDKTRHPNFLSIVSNLTDSKQNNGIRALLKNESIKPVGTPYMAGFEMMALSMLGNSDDMLRFITDYWGGMLSKGATTFWEAYDPNETYEEQYSFYGRPYAKSLCHAWSAGPAAILPAELFGLKPLEDGWKCFTLNPDLGYLKWASVCVPTKYGNIIVDVENNEIQINFPKGTVLQWKDNFIEGPRILTDKF